MLDAGRLLQLIIRELLEELDPKYLGPKKWIYCYRPLEGGCPSRQFLMELLREARASYAKQFERACQGHVLRGEKWHPWKDDAGLFEFKDIQSKSRLIHTTERGNLLVLLFGFTGKKERQIDQVHVNRARRMRDEYQRRVAEIVRRLEKQR